jgi:hypothetical protein
MEHVKAAPARQNSDWRKIDGILRQVLSEDCIIHIEGSTQPRDGILNQRKEWFP